MGTIRTAIWVTLFALLANAGSGSGVALVRPVAMDGDASVCAAQSVIAAMLAPGHAPAPLDVCLLQRTLDTASDEESTATHQEDTPLFGTLSQGTTPDIKLVPIVSDFITLADLAPQKDGGLQRALDYVPPPECLPSGHFRSGLRTPNAPPHHA